MVYFTKDAISYIPGDLKKVLLFDQVENTQQKGVLRKLNIFGFQICFKLVPVSRVVSPS